MNSWDCATFKVNKQRPKRIGPGRFARIRVRAKKNTRVFLIKTASFATAYKRLKNLFFFIFLFSFSLYSQSFSLLCDFRRQVPPLIASGRHRRRWSSDKIRASFNRSEPPGSESVIPLARKSFKVHESEFLDLDQNCFVFFLFLILLFVCGCWVFFGSAVFVCGTGFWRGSCVSRVMVLF